MDIPKDALFWMKAGREFPLGEVLKKIIELRNIHKNTRA